MADDTRSEGQRPVGMKTYQRVIELLEEEKKKAGGSVNAIVKKTGVSHNTITAYLAGRSEPTQDTLGKISRAYGKTISWLRYDTEKTPPVPPWLVDISGMSKTKVQLLEIIKTLPEAKAKALLNLIQS
jgi:transcriptional regulator with XRE-family HTH domain